ncbi:hypothetical protein AVEN_200779-1 [Araneus ventricosus]|uniref:Uncharacterized protein n=1 Tax=Araneus ventricosus TaxID=182803 RepID=A0A4Y2DW19_ARAVE|nr:hypothetical protein AVEN_200779-1 [Araneus ventricosus]
MFPVIPSRLERRESGGGHRFASIPTCPERKKPNGSFERRKKTHLGLTSLGFPLGRSDPLPNFPPFLVPRWQRAPPARQQDPAVSPSFNSSPSFIGHLFFHPFSR